VFEDRPELPDDSGIAHDDAEFAAIVELHSSEALAADECVTSISNDRSHVKAASRVFLDLERGLEARGLADDSYIETRARTFREQLMDRFVAQSRIVY